MVLFVSKRGKIIRVIFIFFSCTAFLVVKVLLMLVLLSERKEYIKIETDGVDFHRSWFV